MTDAVASSQAPRAIILAGGKGTHLGSLAVVFPKPLFNSGLCTLLLLTALLAHNTNAAEIDPGASADLSASDSWGYRIGQGEIPKTVIQEKVSNFYVYPKHPRLFFRDTDIPAIRQRINGEFKTEWQRLLKFVNNTLTQPPLQHAQRPKAWHAGRAVTFVAAITGEAEYRQWAMQWAQEMIRIGPHQGGDNGYRGRLMCLAIVYDWLFPYLTELEKQQIQDSILTHIGKNAYFAEQPWFIGGHSRWGNFSLAAGILAVITEKPQLRDLLLTVRKNFIQGYHPAQAWIAVDGGYHMGWDYSSSYNTVRNHSVWSSATNEDVYYPYQEQLPYFWIYGRLSDGSWPHSGDNYGRTSLHHGKLVAAAGIFKNRHAAWLADINRSNDTFYDILYGDKKIKPLAPGDKTAPLPLSRHFRNAGYVVMRGSWEERSPVIVFKSTSFNSKNHQHRDQNSFSIYYPASRLAIDSGSYEIGSGYGSSHWQNYFTRTIAHNTITVFDPNESFGNSKYGPRSNDGGQFWIDNKLEPRRLEDIQPGGYAHLGGIAAYAEQGSYAFATGDATKAYSVHKLELFTRSLVLLREPLDSDLPIVIVFDKVISTQPAFKKRWLLHSVRQPFVKQRTAEIVEGEGKLQAITVFPQKTETAVVGGPGKQFWVNGKNYPLEGLAGEELKKAHQWAGEWRIEVMPGEASKLDHFLHVMKISDTRDNSPAPRADAIDAPDLKGTLVAGHAVLFNSSQYPITSTRYTLPAVKTTTHLIIGVKPDTVFQLLSESNRQVGLAKSTAGGSLRFSISGSVGGAYSIQAVEE